MREDIFFINVHNKDPLLEIDMAGITYPDSTYMIKRTNSSFFVMEYITEGAGYIECSGKTVKVQKGDFYCLNQGSTHTYYSDKKNPYTKIWVNTRGLLVRNLMNVYDLTGDVIVQHIDVLDIFSDLHRILKQDISASEKRNLSALKLHELIQTISQSVNKTKKQYKNSTAKKIRDLLESNVDGRVSLDELSKMLFLSKVQLIRIFKKEYHTTPYAYFLKYKIFVAKKLLMNTNMMVKEIAEKLGFTDEHHFCNLFKKETGLPPNQLRKVSSVNI